MNNYSATTRQKHNLDDQFRQNVLCNKSVPWCFNKIPFFKHWQLHGKFTVYTADGEDLHVPKRPPPSTGDLVKCQLKNYIFFSSIMLWFHKMSCICKQLPVSLSSL